MKLYTFLDENDNIIEEVRAENHDQAIERAGAGIDFHTDFYSGFALPDYEGYERDTAGENSRWH